MAKPSLRLSDIPTEGRSLDCRVNAEELGLAPVDVQACEAFSLHAEIVPLEDEFAVKGVVSGRVLRQCVRCLKDYQERLDLPFTAQYRTRKDKPQPPAKQPEASSEGLPEDVSALAEGEIYSYTGDQVDLVPMLREQIILASPMQALCREDCRGLCPTCGQDRNLKPCGCVDKQLSNPFMVLRGLRARSEESSPGD